MYRQLAGNLRNGLSLALLRPAVFTPTLRQLVALLALGWIAAVLADLATVERVTGLSIWGLTTSAARSYWWLASITILLCAGVAAGRRERTLLPLLVALASAQLIVWLAWLTLVWLGPRLDADIYARFYQHSAWVFLAWQSAIFLRGWTSFVGGPARITLAATALFAGAYYVILTELPDYSIVESSVDSTSVTPLNIENTYYRQAGLLDTAVQGVAVGAPGRIELNVVTFGAYGAEDVFKREAQQVGNILASRYATGERTIRLLNHRDSVARLPLANAPNLAYVLGHLARRMDRHEDILFLFMTSHGAENGEFAVELDALGLNALRPPQLRKILDESGIRWRVIVVSACYSGQFIDALKSPTTLVITAAAKDKTSFGCAHENVWTYFGEAYFKDALAQTQSFTDAFDVAKKLIVAREKGENKTPSEPQISVGAEIAPYLRRFEAEIGAE